jgi:hypothetical protein
MISFNFGLGDINAVNYANRLAARRQTEEQRAQIRAKYLALVGSRFPSTFAANAAADRELDSIPEYWDNDSQPRLPLNPTSTMISRIEPRMGGAFIYFRSNPSKGYFYPAGGSTAATAKKVEQLVISPDVEKHFQMFWK